MSRNERIRLDTLGRVKRGELTVVAAAAVMGLSLRQARRAWKRYKELGDAGLVHRLRGRGSNRKLDADLADRIVKRHQERYYDFGPTHACQKLAEDGYDLCANTLRSLLKARHLWQPRRRRGKHRRRRERRGCFGELVQMDGSHHDWFGGRCGQCLLMVMIDDATSRSYARFYSVENLEAAFDVFGSWVRKYGLPRALYVDRHAIYRDEDHPDRPTQFGRAMKELGVELILAHSPQAKGRVENRNGTFQRRLIPEMRLRGIDSMEQANAFLENRYLDEANGQFAVCPRQDQDMHRGTSAEVVLAEVLCRQEQRTVGLDWCVRWRNRWLQIDRCHEGMNLPRRRVLVKALPDGSLILEYKDQRLKYKELASRPKVRKPKKPIVNNKPYKPSARQRPPCFGKAARTFNRNAA